MQTFGGKILLYSDTEEFKYIFWQPDFRSVSVLRTKFSFHRCPSLDIPRSVSFPKYLAVAVITFCRNATTSNNVLLNSAPLACHFALRPCSSLSTIFCFCIPKCLHLINDVVSASSLFIMLYACFGDDYRNACGEAMHRVLRSPLPYIFSY